MQLIDAIRSIQKADIEVRVGVAFVLALLIAPVAQPTQESLF